MNAYTLSHLSDAALLSHDRSVNARGRAATADELASLGEIDARQLYLPAGHPSLHSWCVHVRHMSEDAASRRVTAARLARRFPAVFAMVADGRLHLSALVLLAPWLKLRPELGDELLAAAAHKNRLQLQQLIAERFPQPDAPARVVELPQEVASGTLLESSAPARMPSGAFVRPTSRAARVAPLAPERYRVEYTLDQGEAVRRCRLPPGATLEQRVRAALAMRVRPLLAQSARIQAAQMRVLGVSAPPPPPR